MGKDDGVYVGAWADPKGTVHYLRDDGPAHVLAFAPTRSGKGVAWFCPRSVVAALLCRARHQRRKLRAHGGLARARFGKPHSQIRGNVDRRLVGEVQSAGRSAPAHPVRSARRAKYRQHAVRSRRKRRRRRRRALDRQRAGHADRHRAARALRRTEPVAGSGCESHFQSAIRVDRADVRIHAQRAA